MKGKAREEWAFGREGKGRVRGMPETGNSEKRQNGRKRQTEKGKIGGNGVGKKAT